MTMVIKIENLSKSYLIGHQKQQSYTAIRDVIMDKISGFKERLRHPLSPNKKRVDIEEFWALQDINLNIEQGDRLGIIGRNGAGKSTLLKVLSRITDPTRGRITIDGRVASLLEVGTGFHPELSGRENIYLNGAVLGMTRVEIKRKFDEIVEFSGVEKFLDTPVKRYSSGMYVRLAFAVAAHLEPEILIVDEVLAVGDARFQKKCLGKMREIGAEGRTVLFVSHNLATIQQLTNRAVLLENGRAFVYDSPQSAVSAYIARAGDNEASDLSTLHEGVNISSLRVDDLGRVNGFDTPIHIIVNIDVKEEIRELSFGFGFINSVGARVLTSRCIINHMECGKRELIFAIKDHHLIPGEYSLSMGVASENISLLYRENVLHFSLSDLNIDDPLIIPYLTHNRDTIGTFVPALLLR